MSWLGGALTEISAGTVERALQADGFDRLHQIVDGLNLEGSDSEMVERRNEDDGREGVWAASALATAIPSIPGMAMSSRSRSG